MSNHHPTSADARVAAYATLADIFRPPDGASPIADRGLTDSDMQFAIGDLTRTYNRLFVGPLPPLAHPYESVYRTPQGRLMGEVTMQVIRAYAEAGLALPDDYRDLPDHVVLELEFMAYLAGEEAAARANGDEALILTYLSRQAAFLRDHLTQWIPHFCHRVATADPDGYYGRAAGTLAAFVVRDWEVTSGAWRAANDATSRSSTQQASPTPHHATHAGEWTVAFRPERDFIPCTLCGICAEVCRPTALRLVQNEWDVTLTFDPARCDGCGYCVKHCPERILGVEPSTSLRTVNAGDDQTKQLAASAIVPCAKCGAPLIAEAMLRRVLERFRRMKGDPADEAAMYLCHACKLVYGSTHIAVGTPPGAAR